MNSEIIFYRESNWRGRYGDSNRKDISIRADFSNPAEWPYTLKKVHTRYERGTGSVPVSSETLKLSRDLFLKIRGVIADAKYELASCEEDIENGSMDGAGEAYTFTIDGFSKLIRGDEIYGTGSWEAEKYEENRRTENFVVYSVVKKIEDLLASANICLW